MRTGRDPEPEPACRAKRPPLGSKAAHTASLSGERRSGGFRGASAKLRRRDEVDTQLAVGLQRLALALLESFQHELDGASHAGSRRRC